MRIILNIKGTVLVALLLGVAGSARGADAPTGAIEARLEPGEAPGPEHGKAFTGDATPVEPGHVEFEIAYAPSWWAVPGAVDAMASQQHPVVAAVTVGIVQDLDLRLATGWALVHAAPDAPGAPVHGEGLADSAIGARWRFLSLPDPAIDLAVSVAVGIPTGTRPTAEHLGTGRGSWSVGGSLLASADWGRFTAGAEISFAATVGASGSNDVGLLGLGAAAGYQLLPWLQPVVELTYQHEIETGEQLDERVLWASAGLVLPLDRVRLVVGGRVPVWSRDTQVGPMATAAVKLAF